MEPSDHRVHVVEILEATDGGTRTHILHVLEGLDRQQFRLTLIASAARNPAFRDDMKRLQAGGVEVIEVPMVRRIAPVSDCVALLRLRKALRALGAEVVHTHASKAGMLGRVAARWAGIHAVLHTPHVFYFQGKSGLTRRFYRAIERAMLPLTTRLVLLSEGQRRLALDELGASPSQAVVIENAVDAGRFSPKGKRREARAKLGLPDDAPVVGSISRFVPQKACEVLLAAMGRVAAELPECRFVLVGDGPLRKRVSSLAEEVGLSGRLVWRPRTETPAEIYEALDVFLLSSRYEGMPYTLLEAMSMGLPVVATAIPGCSEVVENGITGFLAAPEDAEGLARGMLRFLREPDFARKVGAAGRNKTVHSFPLPVFLRRLSELYTTTAHSE